MPDESTAIEGAALPKLSPRHQTFVDSYLSNGLNAAAADRDAKYTDYREGYRLLQREDVSTYVRMRLDEAGFTVVEIAQRLRYFAEGDMRDFLRVAPSERSYWVRADQHEEIREVAKRRGVLPNGLDNYDLAGIVGSENVAQTEDGVLMVCIRQVASEVVTDWRAAEQAQALGRIKKLKIGKDGTVEFELHDPTKALELLGRAQRMFVDRQEVSGSVDLGVKYIAGLSEEDL
ncbi:terminase small subunit [Deinococcus sp. KNUC1210]|uniref:terminase small subunit n=1 Tax=Deinococcus sp. KNUC1210 TaxID=2917691 RepID=UPI001EF0B00C|nr:terminase small subunit [Deinococcus sp. KNUC1210]ULH15996.1 terminase small subunit [Deinococcus sp. KNUC1210]